MGLLPEKLTRSLPTMPVPVKLNFKLGRDRDPELVGLDIQPGLVAAVQARVNGTILAERAAALPLHAEAVREGDVADADVLSETLQELFASSGLGKRVRVGVANQRTVMRTLELPPVTERKDLAAAVQFMAQDQVPMPLASAVLDFQPLGVVETPSGPRQRVVLVAAQRDMIERLLSAVRRAGLRPEGIDLSAFAMIRSLYRADEAHSGRVLYLNVDGLTNVAIAEGPVCLFTRVLGGGLEQIAAQLAERRAIPLVDARALLGACDLSPTPAAELAPAAGPEGDTEPAADPASASGAADAPPDAASDVEGGQGAAGPEHAGEPAPAASELAPAVEAYPPTPSAAGGDQASEEVRNVLESGIREISGEVRNSLEFHRTQEGGGEVSRVVLSGSALDIPGFADALQLALGVEVRGESVRVADGELAGSASANRLAVAAGLAASEAPQ